LIDFTSNDYIGFSKSSAIFQETHQFLLDTNCVQNGATGSRLISGNHKVYEAENFIAQFHQSETAFFNSGYDANVGFVRFHKRKFIYELCHASIRDGIRLSNAQSYKFAHNDFENLELLIERHANTTIYIVTESVFSGW
jgi:8-amino-7-oxononanoate synthase